MHHPNGSVAQDIMVNKLRFGHWESSCTIWSVVTFLTRMTRPFAMPRSDSVLVSRTNAKTLSVDA